MPPMKLKFFQEVNVAGRLTRASSQVSLQQEKGTRIMYAFWEPGTASVIEHSRCWFLPILKAISQENHTCNCCSVSAIENVMRKLVASKFFHQLAIFR
jgi:hypothetical protein